MMKIFMRSHPLQFISHIFRTLNSPLLCRCMLGVVFCCCAQCWQSWFSQSPYCFHACTYAKPIIHMYVIDAGKDRIFYNMIAHGIWQQFCYNTSVALHSLPLRYNHGPPNHCVQLLNYRKDVYVGIHYFVHLCFAFALMCAYVAFLAGLTRATENRVSFLLPCNPSRLIAMVMNPHRSLAYYNIVEPDA